MIKVSNLTKSYGQGERELVVLKNLSLSVKEGEFVSIIGRSGSGKSTLLHQVGILDYPNSGEIILDGADVSILNEDERTDFRLRKLGYVFQDYALVPELTAIENVAVPLLMQGLGKEEAYEKAASALTKVGLKNRLSNLPNQLSGGEQQRVSIARAIGHDPKIIFADEPTANLDSETANTVMQSFLELHKGGQTIVMVTHEPEYAEMTERAVRLDDGHIVADGAPAEVMKDMKLA